MGVCVFGLVGDCNTKNNTNVENVTTNDSAVITKIKNKISQNCNTSSSSSSNTINIIGSKIKNFNSTQKNSVETLCKLQSILSADIGNNEEQKVLNAIKENLKSKGTLLGSSAENSSVSKNITNNSSSVETEKFNEISKDCILGIKQSNVINIIAAEVEDSNIDQVNLAYLKCMSAHSDDTKIERKDINDTKTLKELEADAKGSNPLKDITDLIGNVIDTVFGGSQMSMFATILIIVLALLASSGMSFLT